MLFQSERRGVGIYRTALFLPIVFSLVVTALIWSAFFQPTGVLNTALASLGLENLQRVWLGDPDTALYAVIVAALWREIGYVMVLFIAGLKGIDPAVTEAAARRRRHRVAALPAHHVPAAAQRQPRRAESCSSSTRCARSTSCGR